MREKTDRQQRQLTNSKAGALGEKINTIDKHLARQRTLDRSSSRLHFWRLLPICAIQDLTAAAITPSLLPSAHRLLPVGFLSAITSFSPYKGTNHQT